MLIRLYRNHRVADSKNFSCSHKKKFHVKSEKLAIQIWIFQSPSSLFQALCIQRSDKKINQATCFNFKRNVIKVSRTWGPGTEAEGREPYNRARGWGLNKSNSLRIRLLSLFRMVVLQIMLKSFKFTSKRNWTPTWLHYPLTVLPSIVYLGWNCNPFNDLEELEHRTLEAWGKCASNLKIIMKSIK